MNDLPRIKKTSFPDTQWSTVALAAGSSTNDETRRALDELLGDYLSALRLFLISKRGIPADLAQDLIHDFVIEKVLERDFLDRADPGRGRFRNYLVKSLNLYVNSALKRKYRQRTHTYGLDVEAVVAVDIEQIKDEFDVAWTAQIVAEALDNMEAECRAGGHDDMWRVFRARIVDSAIKDQSPSDYRSIVSSLGIESPQKAIQLLASGKRCFLRHLRKTVGKHTSSEEETDAEVADLRRIISSSPQ